MSHKFSKSKENFKKKEKSERPNQIDTARAMNTETEIVISKSLRKWEECKFSEKNIQHRSYHSCVVYNSNLYLYGGYEINKGIMNDFFCLDLESKECYTWTNLTKSSSSSCYPGYFLFFHNKLSYRAFA